MKHELIKSLEEISLKAGEYLLVSQQKLDILTVEEKTANQLVSEVDVNTEKMIVAHLSKDFPEAGFITEEGTSAQNEKELHFIIDPLDGTTNFLHGLGVYCTSIAAVYKNELVAAAIYVPVTKEMFTATKGDGAFLNGISIAVSKTDRLSNSLIATGFPYYNFEGKENYIKSLDFYMQNTRGLRRMGSAAIDLAYTACGRFCAFFEMHLSTWDVAAGILIIEEAGGKVSKFNGDKRDWSGKEIAASNKNLNKDFVAVLQKHFTN